MLCALYAPTGVCWIDIYDLQIEFHSRQAGTQSSGTARIHACLLRVLSDGGKDRLEKDSRALGEALALLTFLEVVVLETSHWINNDDVSSLLGWLRNGCSVGVQHRTCNEAHKLALQAKKSPSPLTGGGLLSPFWCSDQPVTYTSLYDW